MQSAVMRGDQVRAVPNLAGTPLTPTERRVIALTAAGRTLAQIAYELGMAVQTVKNHRARIQAKFGVENAPSAVAAWLGRDAIERTTDLVIPGNTILKTSLVSSILGLSREVVTRIDPELLPCYRVNGRGDRRYRAADVQRYIEYRTRRPD